MSMQPLFTNTPWLATGTFRLGFLLKTLLIASCLLALLMSRQAFSFTIEETQQGKQFYTLIRQHLDLITDPIANDFINTLGMRLVSYSSDKDEPFHFFIVNDNAINAFAGPAGYIGINSGLIILSENESELASVMAHEIAHVVQHHLARGNERRSQLTWPSVAAIIAGVATGNPAIAAGSIAGVSAGDIQYQINMTRSYEQEADALGIQLLAKAGFNPTAMATFFTQLQNLSRYDATQFPLLLTHPVTQARTAIALNRAQQYPPKKTYYSNATYPLAKARLIALTEPDPSQLKAKAKMQYDKHPKAIFSQYLWALALSANRQYAKAQALFKQLIKQHPHQIIFPYSLAESFLQQKKYQAAVNCLEPLYPYNNDYYPLVMLYARSLMANQQAKQAVSLLENHLNDYSEKLSYWLLISKAEAKADNLVFAHIYRARAYALIGDTMNTKIQYQIALKQPGNNDYTRALIRAQLKRLNEKSVK